MKPDRKPRLRREGTDNHLLPLTIRMPAHLKYACELLAAYHGRSESQVMEWALQLALSRESVGRPARPFSDVITAAWPLAGWRRAMALNAFDRALLRAPERYACALIERSPEQQTIDQWNAEHDTPHPQLDQWHAFIDGIWPTLVADEGNRRINLVGKSLAETMNMPVVVTP